MNVVTLPTKTFTSLSSKLTFDAKIISAQNFNYNLTAELPVSLIFLPFIACTWFCESISSEGALPGAFMQTNGLCISFNLSLLCSPGLFSTNI